MNGWRFALSWRWARYLSLAIVFALVCCLLGVWQLSRRADASAELERIDSNYSSQPVPLTDVLGAPRGGESGTEFDVADKWTPVTATGEYLRDEQLLVRARPYNGNPGFEVLTPLRLADGSVFIVNRGWLPTGAEQDNPDVVPEAPAGTVTVVARLKPSEPTLPGRSAPAGQIPTIQLGEIAELLDEPTYTGAYGLMVSEDPSPANRPLPAKKPVRDEGPHLSYALQWFVFAVFGFLGLGYGLRQEYRIVNEEDPDERERANLRRIKHQSRARSDAEIEDAILDEAKR